MHRITVAAACVCSLLAAGQLGASGPPGSRLVAIADGDDWSLPSWVEATAGSGFYSETVAPAFNVGLRSVDLSWRQLNPAAGTYSTTATGSAQGMSFASYDAQLASAEPFWMRIWASGVEWAPAWVASSCGVGAVGTDYDGQDHLPIWDECVWSHLLDLYRTVFVDWNLRADPRLRFIYVPGAFTWCEFDFDIVDQAVTDHGLTYATFNAWFQHAFADLVAILDGENADPSDDYSYKLVFTGEDYPFGPWDQLDDGFALAAVTAGTGIRTGITELFNFHLNHIPSYGTLIAADGHMVTDEGWPLFDGKRVIATENECYNDCGYSTSDPYYAVKMSNLKALQMRVNWLYVVPGPSYMASYPELWEWVRLSLGKRPGTSPDAWVALRSAEDTYWVDDTSYDWSGRPWVRNLERFMVQRDVSPGGVSQPGSDVYTGVLAPENGTAYEGRRTDVATGNDSLYLDVDDPFLHGTRVPVSLKVTFRDQGSLSWVVEYAAQGGVATTETVTNQGTGIWRTATFQIDDALFDDSLAGGCDLRLRALGAANLEVRFVRLIRLDPPCLFCDGFEGGSTAAWSVSVP